MIFKLSNFIIFFSKTLFVHGRGPFDVERKLTTPKFAPKQKNALSNLSEVGLCEKYDCVVKNGIPNIVFVTWFGPERTGKREKCFQSLFKNMDVPIFFVDEKNYLELENPAWPIHKVVKNSLPFDKNNPKGLSMNHVSDYMRAYVMHHHGGGYHDVKAREDHENWQPHFDRFVDENIFLIGVKEKDPEDIACLQKTIDRANSDLSKFAKNCDDVRQQYDQIVSAGAFIARPKTNFTKEWLAQLDQTLDSISHKFSELSYEKFAAKSPRCCAINLWNYTVPYPLLWSELCGSVFHPLQVKYKEHVKFGLPKWTEGLPHFDMSEIGAREVDNRIVTDGLDQNVLVTEKSISSHFSNTWTELSSRSVKNKIVIKNSEEETENPKNKIDKQFQTALKQATYNNDFQDNKESCDNYMCTRKVRNVPHVVYVMWFGSEMNRERLYAWASLYENIDIQVIPISDKNFLEFEDEKFPIHNLVKKSIPFGKGLSMNHVADYIKAYIMHHYGGGYHDVKPRDNESSFLPHFQRFEENPDLWLLGSEQDDANKIVCQEKYLDLLLEPKVFRDQKYKTCQDVKKNYKNLLSESAYIMRPNTEFTRNWLSQVEKILDDMEGEVLKNPSPYERCCFNALHPYPLHINELHGVLFETLQLKHSDHVEKGLEKWSSDRPFFSLSEVGLCERYRCQVRNGIPNVVFVFWFGPERVGNREKSFQSLFENMDVPIFYVDEQNYLELENPTWPIHKVVKNSLPFDKNNPKGLSMNHVSDYMRAYVMHHHGGGYHDVKAREDHENWQPHFDRFVDENIHLIGVQESHPDDIACLEKTVEILRVREMVDRAGDKAFSRILGSKHGKESGTETETKTDLSKSKKQFFAKNCDDVRSQYTKIVGPQAFIARPRTAFTKEWLKQVDAALDRVSDKFSEFPEKFASKFPRCCYINMWNNTVPYPLLWSELHGSVFQPLQVKYWRHVRFGLPKWSVDLMHFEISEMDIREIERIEKISASPACKLHKFGCKRNSHTFHFEIAGKFHSFEQGEHLIQQHFDLRPSNENNNNNNEEEGEEENENENKNKNENNFFKNNLDALEYFSAITSKKFETEVSNGNYVKEREDFVENNFEKNKNFKLCDRFACEYKNGIPYVTWVFWFGAEKKGHRKKAWESLSKNMDVPILYVDQDNFLKFEVEEHPIHRVVKDSMAGSIFSKGYKSYKNENLNNNNNLKPKGLSYNHLSDYMRNYVLHHFGGAYHDIKFRSKGTNFTKHFEEDFRDENVWLVGVNDNDTACQEKYLERVGLLDQNQNQNEPFNSFNFKNCEEFVQKNKQKVVSGGAYIMRPKTKFTQEHLFQIEKTLDENQKAIFQFPAAFPRCCGNAALPIVKTSYPLAWAELHGNIFHPLQVKYSEHVRHGLEIWNKTLYFDFSEVGVSGLQKIDASISEKDKSEMLMDQMAEIAAKSQVEFENQQKEKKEKEKMKRGKGKGLSALERLKLSLKAKKEL